MWTDGAMRRGLAAPRAPRHPSGERGGYARTALPRPSALSSRPNAQISIQRSVQTVSRQAASAPPSSRQTRRHRVAPPWRLLAARSAPDASSPCDALLSHQRRLVMRARSTRVLQPPQEAKNAGGQARAVLSLLLYGKVVSRRVDMQHFGSSPPPPVTFWSTRGERERERAPAQQCGYSMPTLCDPASHMCQKKLRRPANKYDQRPFSPGLDHISLSVSVFSEFLRASAAAGAVWPQKARHDV